jgi:hypothetical protein
MTKGGLRTFDCRAAVVSLTVPPVDVADEPDVGPFDPDFQAPTGEYAILELVVRHGTPAVRPDDILAGLRQVADLAAPVPPLQSRIAQGPLDPETGHVGDPLGADRDATRKGLRPLTGRTKPSA